ncbi:MAG: hypothetical protein ATN31_10965 [Candidatus Epulonipiscioides saccharophilum]|nr:MAG: hypothetical protein ATN31_10965 [Epulopiscium sp. AS2M-Bin001]
MKEVTLRSTKQQIMDVLIELQEELKKEREAKLTIKDISDKMIKEEKLRNAQKILDLDILKPEIQEQFNDLKFAMEEAKSKLASIQGVTDILIDSEAIIMAKNKIIKDLEIDELNLRESIEKNISKLNQEYEDKKAKLESEYIIKKNKLETELRHEMDNYNYETSRSRKIDNDQWQEQKDAREKALAQKEDLVLERENKIQEREEEIVQLKLKVDSIPELVANSKQEGYKEASKKFDKEKAAEIAVIKSNTDWEIKVAFLERQQAIEDLVKAHNEIEKLQTKLEAAYHSMNTLATITVQSTGGLKIIDTNSKDK